MTALSRLGRALVWMVDRYPLNSPWVHTTLRSVITRGFLPCWFAYHATVSLVYMSHWPNSFAFDVRLYRLAAEAWLAGQDPWAPTLGFDAWHPAISYAGPPPTLLPFILLAWIPVDVLVLGFVLISGAVAMWTLRRLGLPLWWMLFPPLVEGIWVGNLNIFVIALLVAGGSLAGGLAAIAKVYAAVPLLLLGRWKPLVIAGVTMLVTFPFLPWAAFLAQYPRISASLADQAWGGVTNMYTTPLVLAGAGIGLILIGRKQAAWLAVPVLWPATQFHYSVLALPALSPFLAAFAAVNQPGFLGLGVILYALWLRRELVVTVLTRRPSPEIRGVPARQGIAGG
jgi:hypothetical protein